MSKRIVAVLLAGGRSSRMGFNKALADLHGKPLIAHVYDGLARVVDDVILVIGREDDSSVYDELFPRNIKILRDILPSRSPLVGIYTAFQNLNSEYAYVHSCDSPFISPQIIRYLYFRVRGHGAAVPYWPNRGIYEPLHSVYCVEESLKVAEKLLAENTLPVIQMIRKLRSVAYVDVEELRTYDRALLSLFDIDIRQDLSFARSIMKPIIQRV